MNLIIDIGNSYYKCGEFNGDELTRRVIFENEKEFNEYLKSSNFEKAIVSSVSSNKMHQMFNDVHVLFFDHQTNIPISNEYRTPETLGLDRLAAVIGAKKIFPEHDILVIDCGTCITYDFITKNGNYKGGGISPGLRMKFSALNNFTARLPLIEKLDETELIGSGTEDSIMSGVINGTIAEISGIIQKYKNISDNLAPVLCGGDASFLSKNLESEVKLEENLVLIGLNEVLKFNA